MLTLTGTIRATATIGGGTNRKTGEVIPERHVLQVEGLDSRGLVQLYTLTVPDLAPYIGKVGERISVPVRAWATGAAVNLSFEAPR
ncbi:hypothetical protein LZL65_30205 [Pseudomonas aeruginosa]|nr:hypothetical protein [Pseudomonas aeruginosa]